MNKDKRKKVYDPIRALAVKITARHFEITEVYVRAVERGDATKGNADEILKMYKKKYNELKAVKEAN